MVLIARSGTAVVKTLQNKLRYSPVAYARGTNSLRLLICCRLGAGELKCRADGHRGDENSRYEKEMALRYLADSGRFYPAILCRPDPFP